MVQQQEESYKNVANVHWPPSINMLKGTTKESWLMSKYLDGLNLLCGLMSTM